MKPLGPRDPDRLGRNRLLAVVGRGGMGQVLLGQGPDGRLIAVKQIHHQFTGNPEFRARFRREVLASQQVTGAYTAGVVDHDADSETPWLASEYIAGPSLQEMVGEYGRLTVSGLKLLATGLAMALLEIHRTGLVHRDLKPSNVLLTNDGPRVIDFGIAKALEDDVALTATGAVLGSPAYMSPEQAECQPLTPASDVFAVGAVLAMAATGVSPFEAASTPQVLYNVLYTAPDTTAIPPPIRALVEACLAKDPAARPTPEQLLDAASRIEAEPVWPVRIRRRIAECQAEAARWADGTATVAAEPVEQPKRPMSRFVVAAAVVSALVLGVITIVGIGVEGNAVAMDDPALALTVDESRRLDLCELLKPAVLGELGTATGELVPNGVHSCSLSYREQSGRKMQLTLENGSPVEQIKGRTPMGSTINWMPVLGRNKEARNCDRSVVAQSGLPMALTLSSSTFEGSDTCPAVERGLVAVVRRLAVNPPLRDLPANSVLRLDPCVLLDSADIASVTGDPARGRTVHGCVADGREGYVALDLDDRLRPDHVVGGKVRPTRTIAGRTVNVQTENVNYCELAYLTRPSRDDQAEQVRIMYSAYKPGPLSPCDAAATLFAPVLTKLPTS
ncbi:serine/threonine-protein kinase [Nocardia sp. NPDC058379]|uniref:serine/threonine-protein kinase n=1 Tax=unclassified Nocardia TaxID=2637762 RepID=UPI0036692E72